MRSKPGLVLILLLAAGGVYGHYSATFNQNPHRLNPEDPGVSGAERSKGKAWGPSPVWLPSYLVCVVPRRTVELKNPFGAADAPKEVHIVGFGLESRDGKGYNFPSATARTNYRLAGIGVGGGIGLVIAVVVVIAAGWVTLGRRKDDDAPPAPKKEPWRPFP